MHLSKFISLIIIIGTVASCANKPSTQNFGYLQEGDKNFASVTTGAFIKLGLSKSARTSVIAVDGEMVNIPSSGNFSLHTLHISPGLRQLQVSLTFIEMGYNHFFTAQGALNVTLKAGEAYKLQSNCDGKSAQIFLVDRQGKRAGKQISPPLIQTGDPNGAIPMIMVTPVPVH